MSLPVMKSGNTVFAIVGPTGVGKTALALRLAESLPIEAVSVDSRQVYRRMDIGTAKPTPSERLRLRHHLIDVVDPDETYSAGRFTREARAAVEEIGRRGALPFLVGGTGLYLKALAEGLLNVPPSDAPLRAALLLEAEAKGAANLHRELGDVDPEAADRIHPNDLVRIVRALEVRRLTGESLVSLKSRERPRPLKVVLFGLSMPRADLYRRLDRRVDRMMEEGFLEEVRDLLAAGFGEHLRSMQGIGYRELAAYLGGRMSQDEAVAATKRATRNFAKRQMTWFRGMSGIAWIELPPSGEVEEASGSIIRAVVERISSAAVEGKR